MSPHRNKKIVLLAYFSFTSHDTFAAFFQHSLNRLYKLNWRLRVNSIFILFSSKKILQIEDNVLVTCSMIYVFTLCVIKKYIYMEYNIVNHIWFGHCMDNLLSKSFGWEAIKEEIDSIKHKESIFFIIFIQEISHIKK